MNADRITLRPVIVGINHMSGTLALRDAIFVDDAAQPGFLAGLRANGIAQAMALSTCDRVEVLAFAPDAATVVEAVTAAFAARAGIAPAELAANIYAHADAAAVRHCFAVAASLDSQVIGEPHVLGQMRASHRIARQSGAVGAELEALLGAAYGAAKRVRGETTVAERPVSIAAAAVQLARDLHGDLAHCDGLLLGAGEMGELVAESLLAAGLRRILVATPRPERAVAVAALLGAQAAPFAELPRLLAGSEVVVTAVGGRPGLLGQSHLTQALRKRRQKPIFVVDAALPGDVDAAVNRIEGAFLYDLADLERVALEGRAGREQAASQAWAIVEGEVAAFAQDQAERAAVPAIAALHAQFEAMRAQALSDSGGDADKATRLLTSRLLHAPSEAMREIATSADWQAAERLLRRLFRLD